MNRFQSQKIFRVRFDSPPDTMNSTKSQEILCKKPGPPQPGLRHNLQRPASGGALAKGKKVAASHSPSAAKKAKLEKFPQI